jgi:hypothetical protein
MASNIVTGGLVYVQVSDMDIPVTPGWYKLVWQLALLAYVQM